jgi:hypothetical protein
LWILKYSEALAHLHILHLTLCVDTISAVAILISFNVQLQMVQMIQSAIAPWKKKTPKVQNQPGFVQ